MYAVKKAFWAGGKKYTPRQQVEDGEAESLLGFSTLMEKGNLVKAATEEAPVEEPAQPKGKK